MNLPAFPVDNSTLELLHRAVSPGLDADRTSLGEFLDMMSELGGSDLAAIEETFGEAEECALMRDPGYSTSDVIAALVEEIQRVRRALVAVQTAEVVARTHYEWMIQDQRGRPRWSEHDPRARAIHMNFAAEILAAIRLELGNDQVPQ